MLASSRTVEAQPARRAASSGQPFSVVEASIDDMRKALEQRRTTSREIVTQYLTRIATYEHLLNAIITVNPNALAEADARDRERAQGRLRGPLHGIPIALKDNIHTTTMRTTGGALAFADLVPPWRWMARSHELGRERNASGDISTTGKPRTIVAKQPPISPMSW